MFLKDIGICLTDGAFNSDMRIVNLHPFRDTHWILYIHESYFDSYDFSLPQKLTNFIIKPHGRCLHSEYKIQGLTSKRDSF